MTPTASDFFSDVQWSDLTLRVRDLAGASRFWQDVLGFVPIAQHDSRVVLAPPGSTMALVVLEAAPEAPARPPGTAGLFHVAFLYPDSASLGRILKWLLDAGVALGAADHGVSRAVYLSDPEGNGIELYADRPVEHWPEPAPDGQVAMFSNALDFEPLLADAATTDGPLLPADTRIGHVHLAVASLDHAEAFYVDTLGFALRQRSYPGALFVARSGYHHHLGANVWRTYAPAVPGAQGLAHLRLRVARAALFEAMTSRIDAQQLGTDREAGSVWVRDRDGLVLHLTGPEE
jgi:catechol 2,3-dioxygenase